MSTPVKPQIPAPATRKGWNYDRYFQEILKNKAKQQLN